MKCRDDSEIQKAAKYASKAISPKLFCNPLFFRDICFKNIFVLYCKVLGFRAYCFLQTVNTGLVVVVKVTEASMVKPTYFAVGLL